MIKSRFPQPILNKLVTWYVAGYRVYGSGDRFESGDTVDSQNKPLLLTSVGYCVCVTTMGGALLAVPLWFSGVTNIIGGLLWGMVAISTVRSQGGRKWNTTAAWFK